MSGHQHDSWSSGAVVRRWADPSGSGPGSSPVTTKDPDEDDVSASLTREALVDAVVERIEQRVIDELERRGRRQSWAAF